ncbi:uncharacterized protein LY89DRAFT_723391 [Mollisia scopiformis]|uniref:Uncharacterized protein n=1 Tax=Mollisia scopiformis TaxID=149040 RepID=A0A194WT77_MOLSC|nr:uncharacterized protein LY89DRAFT_723391 [Mollisia scopiformis]KUJ10827.1 hypothetical protein LY89DRAFT_723391 [Mollisia scopiformis]
MDMVPSWASDRIVTLVKDVIDSIEHGKVEYAEFKGGSSVVSMRTNVSFAGEARVRPSIRHILAQAPHNLPFAINATSRESASPDVKPQHSNIIYFKTLDTISPSTLQNLISKINSLVDVLNNDADQEYCYENTVKTFDDGYWEVGGKGRFGKDMLDGARIPVRLAVGDVGGVRGS